MYPSGIEVRKHDGRSGTGSLRKPVHSSKPCVGIQRSGVSLFSNIFSPYFAAGDAPVTIAIELPNEELRKFQSITRPVFSLFLQEPS